MVERGAARQSRLSSPDGARERERRGRREENEERRKRAEFSGVLTGRCVCEYKYEYLCVNTLYVCCLRVSVW